MSSKNILTIQKPFCIQGYHIVNTTTSLKAFFSHLALAYNVGSLITESSEHWIVNPSFPTFVLESVTLLEF